MRSVAVVVALAAAVVSARADDTVARDAYRRAQEHASANPPRWAEACPLYEASYRADPQIGVLLYLADCYEQLGRFASAWSAFDDAAELAKARQDNREPIARDRAKALEPKLSRLQVIGPARAGLVIKRDGTDITLLAATGVPVDPGDRVISATAPGHVEWKTTVKVTAPGTLTVTIPELEKLPAGGEPPVVPPKPKAEPKDASVAALAANALTAARTGRCSVARTITERVRDDDPAYFPVITEELDGICATAKPRDPNAPMMLRKLGFGVELGVALFQTNDFTAPGGIRAPADFGATALLSGYGDIWLSRGFRAQFGLRLRAFKHGYDVETGQCGGLMMCPDEITVVMLGPAVAGEMALGKGGRNNVHLLFGGAAGFGISSTFRPNQASSQQLPGFKPQVEVNLGLGFRRGSTSFAFVGALTLTKISDELDFGSGKWFGFVFGWSAPR